MSDSILELLKGLTDSERLRKDVTKSKKEADSYKNTFGKEIPPKKVCEAGSDEWKPSFVMNVKDKRVLFAEVEYNPPRSNESTGEINIPDLPLVDACDFALAGVFSKDQCGEGKKIIALAVYVLNPKANEVISDYFKNMKRNNNEATEIDQIQSDYFCVSVEMSSTDNAIDKRSFSHYHFRGDSSLEEFKSSLEGQLQVDLDFFDDHRADVRIKGIACKSGPLLYPHTDPKINSSDCAMSDLLSSKKVAFITGDPCQLGALDLIVEIEPIQVSEVSPITPDDLPTDRSEMLPDKVHLPQRIVAQRLYARAVRMLGGEERFAKFKELSFIILTPVFSTLVTQTANRVVKMNLCSEAEKGRYVFPYSGNHRESFEAFKAYAMGNPHVLCVAVADECHWGIIRHDHDQSCFGAHDKFINDPELCKRKNYLVLLVSASPYNVLTCNSRIPEKYVVADGGDFQDCDKADKDSEELHVVKWFSPQEMRDGQEPVTQYRRLEHYLQTVSSLNPHESRMLCHQYVRACRSFEGLHSFLISRFRLSSSEVLLLDYILSFQYFKLIRWDSQDLKLRTVESSRKLIEALTEDDLDTFEKQVVRFACKAEASEQLGKIKASTKIGEFQKGVENAIRHMQRECGLELTEASAATQSEEPIQGDVHASPDEDAPGPEVQPSKVDIWRHIFNEKIYGEELQHRPDSTRSTETESWYTETDRIVGDLLSTPLTTELDSPSVHDDMQNGHMKVVRVLNSVEGRAFERVLRGCLSEFSSGATKPASIIADFGASSLHQSIEPWARKCKLWQLEEQEGTHNAVLRSLDGILESLRKDRRGKHEKKHVDLEYGHLYGLPCILILVNKGRMGDTFPQTFNCLDLRARTSENYSTFVQEMGRLCRYPCLFPERLGPFVTPQEIVDAASTQFSVGKEIALFKHCKAGSDVFIGYAERPSKIEALFHEVPITGGVSIKIAFLRNHIPYALNSKSARVAIERAYDISKVQSGVGVLDCVKLNSLDKFMTPKADKEIKKKLGIRAFEKDAKPYHDYRRNWQPRATNAKNAKDRGSYDEYNCGDGYTEHERRLLLFAETQIGKTGAYTCFLHLLREACEANGPLLPTIYPFINAPSLISDSFKHAYLWALPYWADLTEAKPLEYCQLKVGK